MRVSSLLLFVSVWMLGGCDNGAEKTAGGVKVRQDTPPTGDFYRRFTGTIAGKPVVMHLHRMGNWVGGSYSYNAVGIPISLTSWNDATPGNDVVELQEFSEAGPLDETYSYPRLQLTLTDIGADGIWISADSGRRLEVVLKTDYGNGSLRLNTFSLVDSARLLPSRPLPQASFALATVMAERAADDWINAAIRDAAGAGSFSSWLQASRALANRYFAEYQGSVEVDTTDPSDLERAMHNWSAESRATVVMNEVDWLVIKSFSASYSGGAHGNYGSSFIVLDRAGKRQWTLTDVVADTAALAPFLLAAAVDRWRLSPEAPITERLLVDAVPVTGNFYLTPTGLGFVYNPYEIASYADGEVHLFIPYKRTLLLLTEEFKQRMKLSNSAAMRG